jgi:hypothetical protein
LEGKVAISLLRLSLRVKIGGCLELLNHQHVYEINTDEMKEGFQRLARFLIGQEPTTCKLTLSQDVRVPWVMMLPPGIVALKTRPFEIVNTRTAALVLRKQIDCIHLDELKNFVELFAIKPHKPSRLTGLIDQARCNGKRTIFMKIVNGGSGKCMQDICDFHNLIEIYCANEEEKQQYGLQAYEANGMVYADSCTIIFMHDMGCRTDNSKGLKFEKNCAECLKLMKKTEMLCHEGFFHGDIRQGNLMYEERATDQLCLID